MQALETNQCETRASTSSGGRRAKACPHVGLAQQATHTPPEPLVMWTKCCRPDGFAVVRVTALPSPVPVHVLWAGPPSLPMKGLRA